MISSKLNYSSVQTSCHNCQPKAKTYLLTYLLLCTSVFSSFSQVKLCSFISRCTVLLQFSFGLHPTRFPSGFHLRAVRTIAVCGILKMWPINCHLRRFISVYGIRPEYIEYITKTSVLKDFKSLVDSLCHFPGFSSIKEDTKNIALEKTYFRFLTIFFQISRCF